MKARKVGPWRPALRLSASAIPTHDGTSKRENADAGFLSNHPPEFRARPAQSERLHDHRDHDGGHDGHRDDRDRVSEAERDAARRLDAVRPDAARGLPRHGALDRPPQRRKNNQVRILADSAGTLVVVVRPINFKEVSDVTLSSNAPTDPDTIVYDARGLATSLPGARKFYITVANGRYGAGTVDSLCVTRFGLVLDRNCGAAPAGGK
jgi:hypothetical protein